LEANGTCAGSLQLLALDKEAAQAVMIHHKVAGLEKAQICCKPGKDCTPETLDLPQSAHFSGKTTPFTWTKLPFDQDLQLIPTPGVYWLLLSSCNSTNPPLNLSISIQLTNPFGNLSTEQYSLMGLYGWLSGIYAFLLAMWGRQVGKYWNSAWFPQRWAVPLLLVCCVLEMACSWADLKAVNGEGRRIPALAGLTVLLNSWKGAYSRMLLLALSTGLGLTQHFLSPALLRILLFGLVYFLCSLGYSLLQYLVLSGSALRAGLMLAAFPMAVLNTLCMVWVYLALKANVQQLKVNQDPRFELFARVGKALGLVAALALGWLLVDGLLKATSESEEYRAEAWRVEAVWQVVFLALLLPSLWLLRPTATSLVPEIQSEEEKEMDVEMTSQESFSQAVYRQRGPHSFSIVD